MYATSRMELRISTIARQHVEDSTPIRYDNSVIPYDIFADNGGVPITRTLENLPRRSCASRSAICGLTGDGSPRIFSSAGAIPTNLPRSCKIFPHDRLGLACQFDRLSHHVPSARFLGLFLRSHPSTTLPKAFIFVM